MVRDIDEKAHINWKASNGSGAPNEDIVQNHLT